MKNTYFHHIGDIVYVQYRISPVAVTQYEVIGIHIRKGAVDTAFELLNHETGQTLMDWSFRIFRTPESALNYREEK